MRESTFLRDLTAKVVRMKIVGLLPHDKRVGGSSADTRPTGDIYIARYELVVNS